MIAHPDRRLSDAVLLGRGARAAEAPLRLFPEGREQRFGERTMRRGAGAAPGGNGLAQCGRLWLGDDFSTASSNPIRSASVARLGRRRRQVCLRRPRYSDLIHGKEVSRAIDFT